MEMIKSLLQAIDVTMKTLVILQYYLAGDIINGRLSAAFKKPIIVLSLAHFHVLL